MARASRSQATSRSSCRSRSKPPRAEHTRRPQPAASDRGSRVSARSHRTRRREELHMIGFIIAGLIIGLLARLLLPGRQRIGLLWTLALGVVGSVVGGV